MVDKKNLVLPQKYDQQQNIKYNWKEYNICEIMKLCNSITIKEIYQSL